MVIAQGEIWWADLPDPTGSGPGLKRPVLIVQGDGCLLQICHLGRLTGVLRARDEDRETVVRWR